MAKSKDRSETERLKGRIRELEAELRKAKQRETRANKETRRMEDLEESNKELHLELQELSDQAKKKKRKACANCGSLNYEEIELGPRVLVTCDDCGQRYTIAKKG